MYVWLRIVPVLLGVAVTNFELHCSINSKWQFVELCHYCTQLAIRSGPNFGEVDASGSSRIHPPVLIACETGWTPQGVWGRREVLLRTRRELSFLQGKLQTSMRKKYRGVWDRRWTQDRSPWREANNDGMFIIIIPTNAHVSWITLILKLMRHVSVSYTTVRELTRTLQHARVFR